MTRYPRAHLYSHPASYTPRCINPTYTLWKRPQWSMTFPFFTTSVRYERYYCAAIDQSFPIDCLNHFAQVARCSPRTPLLHSKHNSPLFNLTLNYLDMLGGSMVQPIRILPALCLTLNAICNTHIIADKLVRKTWDWTTSHFRQS